MSRFRVPPGLVLALVLAAMAAGGPGMVAVAWAQEQPIAPEANPPGDIPDSQVLITYESPLGLTLKIPEGWARTDRADGAFFADRYDSVDLSVAPAPAAPTADSVRRKEIPELVRAGHAVEVSAVRTVTLAAGSAVLVVYTSNSEPNAVTGKRIRLDNDRYLFYRAGRVATLTLSAPAGADNADQWRLMAESLRWN
jgi:hypothetical protein